jgi:DinB superfamily
MVGSHRQEILQELKRGSDALREALDGVDEDLAICKPSPGRWSILECLEHLAVSEKFLMSRVREARRSDQPHGSRLREKTILDRGADRTRPAKSPEVGRPNGRFQSLNQALSCFDSVRTETICFVEGFGDDLRFWLTDHPLMPGPVNCYEMLLVIAAHPVRHAKQIAEIRVAVRSADGGAGHEC